MRFFDITPVGKIVTRLTNDVDAINDVFSNVLVRLFKNSVKILGLMAVMLALNAKAALVAFALVPVALIRRGVISLVFGSELFARGEELSLHRLGWLKFIPAVLLMTAAFLLPYIWLDDAGTRPFWFGAAKFTLSLLLSGFLSVFVCDILLEDSAARWR